jgi:two-component system response regulator MprA
MKRVLVVEDEPTIRAVVSEALQDEGYTVETAADGGEALAKVRNDPPDAVVLDLVLPATDGQAFVEECRSEPSGQSLPIAVMSAMDGAARIARRLPVQAFVRKPFDLAHLLEMVEALLPKRPAPVAARAGHMREPYRADTTPARG